MASSSPTLFEPLPLVLHGDLLDPWCWIAERRIAAAAVALHGAYRPVERAHLPRSWEPRAPTLAERRRRARDLERAARDPNAPPFSHELWSEHGGPLCSAPAHLAVAAARLQGAAAAEGLACALREAALVRGLDVSRRDVIVEIAHSVGLDVRRFLAALDAPFTERALRAEVERAEDLGVRSSPSLVIDEAWLVAGLRSVDCYRELLARYLARPAGATVANTVH